MLKEADFAVEESHALTYDTLVDTLSQETESSFHKYQGLYIGSDSLVDLLTYLDLAQINGNLQGLQE
jgi:hypothetical protein